MRAPILKSKRGIALESAILFMVMVFSFCFLLTSLALFGHYSVKLQQIKAEIDVEIEQIGEDFVYSRLNGEDFGVSDEINDKYEISTTETTLKITTKKGTDLLYVVVENGNITQWVTSPPQ